MSTKRWDVIDPWPPESGEHRLLRFPDEPLLGWISRRPSRQHWPWGRLTEARGDVRVPASSLVKLRIDPRWQNDLSPLTRLPTDAVFEVDCSQTQISDEDLKYLAHLSGLVVLKLEATGVGDAALSSLRVLTALEQLVLEETTIEGEGLQALDTLSSLRRLVLAGTRLDDAGLAYLPPLAKLQFLDISNTYVTDKGLEHLKKLSGLKIVSVYNTAVRQEGAEAFVRAAPQCRVSGHWISASGSLSVDEDTSSPRIKLARGPYLIDQTTPSGKRFQCACCGFFTVKIPDTHEICQVCWWQDDGISEDDPAFEGAANVVSLRECQEVFLHRGAVDNIPLYRARPPLPEETPPELEDLAHWLEQLDRTHPFPPMTVDVGCDLESLSAFMRTYKESPALAEMHWGKARIHCPREDVGILLSLSGRQGPELSLVLLVSRRDTLREWYEAIEGLATHGEPWEGGSALRLGEEPTASAIVYRTLTAIGRCTPGEPVAVTIEW